MVGLTITAMVGAALAAFAFAMSRAWTDSGEWEALQQSTQQGAARISDTARKTRYVGVRENGTVDGSGSAARYVLWFGNNGDSNANDTTDLDDVPQLAEFGVLQHNKEAQLIELHCLVYPAGTTQSYKNLVNSFAIDMTSSPDLLISLFKAINSDHQPRVLCRNVTGAVFDLQGLDVSDRPEFRFTLTASNAKQTITENGIAAMRSVRPPG